MQFMKILAIAVGIVGALYLIELYKKGYRVRIRFRVRQVPSANPVESLPKLHNHLGKAAVARGEALQAIREGEHDKAWGLLHEVKSHYLDQARFYGMTARQALALDASVHKHLANILRKEGKHEQAFIHVLYCYGATGGGLNKSEAGKFRAYFNRCKIAPVTLEQAHDALTDLKSNPSFERAQEAFSKLKAESEKMG